MSVGGINIQVGVGLQSFAKGVKKGESLLKDFQKKMTGIRLDKAIKGNPFANTNRYMKESRKTLNTVFDEWSKEIRIAGNNMDQFATRSKKSVQTIITQFEKLQKKQKLFTSGIFKTGEGSTPLESLKGHFDKKGVVAKTGKNDVTAQLKKIRELPAVTGQVQAQITKSINRINKGLKVNVDTLYKYVSQAFNKVSVEYSAFQQKLQKGFLKQGALQYQEDLKQAKSLEKVQQDRIKTIKSLLVEEKRLKANISAGLSVKENRIKLAKKYEERQKLGMKLTKEQIRLMKEVNAKTVQYKPTQLGTPDQRNIAEINRKRGLAMVEVTKAERNFTNEVRKGNNVHQARINLTNAYKSAQRAGLTLTKEQIRIMNEVNAQTQRYQAVSSLSTKITKDTGLAIAETHKQEKRARMERQRGINIIQNKVNIMKALETRQRLGVTLSKQQQIELQKLNKWYKKTQQSAHGFLSPGWFKERLLWFVQLRGAWAIWRGVGETFRDLVELQNQVARAMRTANSVFLDSAQIANRYKLAILEAGGAQNATFEEAGEVLYQLTSAGLSSEEALAGLASTLSNIIGLEGDARDVTKAVAGLYNNYSEIITEVSGKQEKFAYINDLVAAAWKRNQIEVSELTEAYKYASPSAINLGIDLKKLTAILATSHNHLIKAGMAGRALRNIFMRLAQTPREFSETFQIDIDPSNFDFMKVMDELFKRYKEHKFSLNEISDVFARMGIRGADLFQILLKHWDEVNENVANFNDIQGESFEIQEQKLDSLGGQFGRFAKVFKSVVNPVIEDSLNLLKESLKYWSDVILKMQESINMSRNIRQSPVVGTLSAYGGLVESESRDVKRSFVSKLSKEEREDIRNLAKDYEVLKKEFEELGGVSTLAGRRFAHANDKFRTLGNIVDNQGFKELLNIIDKVERMEALSGAGTKKPELVKFTKSEAQLEYEWKYKIKNNQKQIEFIEKRILENRKSLNASLKDAENAKTDSDRDKIYTDVILPAAKKITAQENQVLRLKKEITDKEKDLRKSQVERLRLQKDSLQAEIKNLSFQEDILEKQERSKEVTEKLKGIHEQVQKKKNSIVDIDSKISALNIEQGDSLEGQKKEIIAINNELSKRTNATEKIASDEEDLLKFYTEQKKAINNNAQDRLISLEKEKELLKINNASDEEIYRIESKVLDVNLEKLYNLKDIAKETEDIRDLDQEIRDLEIERLQLNEKIKRELNPVYDAMQKIKAEAQDFNDLVSDVVYGSHGALSSGFGDFLQNLTGGFQEVQQEVANLKGEIKELEVERNALAEQEFLSEEEAEKYKELNEEINKTRNKINELEDPLKNAKNAFKDFAKSVIDSIRQIINEWIAMQIVTGIFKAFAGSVGSSGGGITDTSGAAWDLGSNPFGLSAKSGGVLPQISSMQSFATGGVTSNPALAILGDNASKKELVIPSENINSDQVSGYTREQEKSITIVNAIGENDIANELAKPQSGKVIVNWVYREQRNKV